MPIDAPVIRKTRMIAPRVAPMVRRIAMSLDLSFTSMIRPEMMLSAATSTISVRMRNITLRSTSRAREEGAVALAPVGQDDRPPGRLLDRRARLVDPVGIVEIDLDRRSRRRRG